eukprot:1860364-Amphidinium_carterae.1
MEKRPLGVVPHLRERSVVFLACSVIGMVPHSMGQVSSWTNSTKETGAAWGTWRCQLTNLSEDCDA